MAMRGSFLVSLSVVSSGNSQPFHELWPEVFGPTYHLGDFDSDGLVDAYVVDPLGTDRLFRNAGEGRFEDVTERHGLNGARGSTSALWLDFDGDGALDLYVSRADGAGRLFQNTGAGAFVDVSEASGIDVDGGQLFARTLDVDGAGGIDLQLVTEYGDALFVNRGAGRFERVELPDSSEMLARNAGFGAPGAELLGADATPEQRAEFVRAARAAWVARRRAAAAGASGSGALPFSMSAPSSSAAQPSTNSNSVSFLAACVGTIIDQQSGLCLQASSTPALGQLYPLSANLFVSTSGSVGIGTTTPVSKFNVVDTGQQPVNVSSSNTGGTWSNLTNTSAGGDTWNVISTGASSSEGSGKLLLRDADTSTVAMTLQPDGRVGIGTSAPENQFHVLKGSAGATTAHVNAVGVFENSTSAYVSVLTPDGTERGVIFSGPTLANGGGLFHNSAFVPNGFELRTGNNTTRLTVTNAGDVGIGTQTPVSRFNVVDTAQQPVNVSSSNTGGTWSNLVNTSVGGDTWNVISTGATSSEGAGKLLLRDADTSTVAMTLQPDGNVGIGTSAPPARLAVLGTAHIDVGDANTGTTNNTLKFGSAGTGEAIGSKRTGSGGLNGLDFFTGGVNRVHMDNNGDVGIGTTSPATKLHVLDTDSLALKIESSNTGGTWSRFTNTSSGGDTWALVSAGSGNSEGTGKLLFRDDDTSTVAMTLTPSGSLGVGTSFPSSRLHVSDSAQQPVTIASSNTGGTWSNFTNSSAGGDTWNLISTGSANSEGAGKLLLRDGDTSTIAMALTPSGFVGLGTTNPVERLDVNGATRTQCVKITGGCDLAEPFESAERHIEAGLVVSIDPEHEGQVRVASAAYDTTVVGVVSGAGGVHTGMTMSQEGLLDMGAPIALVGRVYVWCDASHGEIRPGDLLTSSSTAGHAMKAADRARATGAILGKALTTLSEGRGLVLMVVTLQ
ncbi:MAG: VCBS repeat-containing protein [Planctomycetes bacterium]|nr:VCBS repeat-containing protein [Planctomycetota bacterium]